MNPDTVKTNNELKMTFLFKEPKMVSLSNLSMLNESVGGPNSTRSMAFKVILLLWMGFEIPKTLLK